MVRQKAFREFNKKIDSISKVNKLEDIPLKIYSISKNPHGKGAIVQFYANEIDPTNKSLPIKIIYNVFGLMSEKIASTHSETADRTYFIKGHHYIRAKETMVSILTNSTKYPTEQKILDKILDTYYINLGSFICKVDSVK